MEFDRSAPGAGAEARCKLENGKAFLEWRFHVKGDLLQTEIPGAQARRFGAGEGYTQSPRPVIRLSLMAGEGNVVAEGMQTVGEEEPLKTVLVQPRLWQGRRDPFLYEVEATLTVQGACLDRIYTKLCLREVHAGGAGEILLNGQPLAVRAVSYSLPEGGSETERRRQALSDFRTLLQLGANSICVERKDQGPFLSRLCDRFGILMFERGGLEGQDLLVCAWDGAVEISWGEEGQRERVPAYRGDSDAFFLAHRKCPTALYYKYKARWSEEPFVYLAPESVRRLRSGNYTVTCYSSCGRVALYTDGELFEFRKGDGEFVFQEVPARTPCIMLSAEGDGCSGALSVHKSFVKSMDRDEGKMASDLDKYAFPC